MLFKNQIKISVFLTLIFFVATGCSKNEKSDKFVAKVNDAVLTEEQINRALSEKRNSGKNRSEFIQNWIEKEILYQEALKNGILDGNEFKTIIEQSKKELAASLYINKFLDQENTTPTEEEIQQYYESCKDDFKLNDDLFRVNIIYMNDFDRAVQFRNKAIETSWKNALNSSQNSSSIISVEQDRQIFRYQFQPPIFMRSVSALQKDEISLVMETEPAKFVVVQLIEKLGKDTIPPLSIVKVEVQTILTIILKKEKLKKYIDKLIADHNLEIKRYSE